MFSYRQTGKFQTNTGVDFSHFAQPGCKIKLPARINPAGSFYIGQIDFSTD